MSDEKRQHPRFPVPPRVPLRCDITLGSLTFEATVVNLSLGGIGTVVYDASIHIDPGTRIADARILYPRREPIVIGMEVRHVALIALPDGRPANRAGCSIFGAQQDIEDLVRLFLAGLEQ